MGREPTIEDWARMRHEYESTGKPVADIAADGGVSPGTLRDRIRRWVWTRRRTPIPRQGPPPPLVPQIEPPVAPAASVPPSEGATAGLAAAPQAAIGASTEAPGDDEPASIVPRLQSAVARVLPAIERTLAQLTTQASHPREMEQAGRALASLTRTLRELNALLAQHAPREDDYDDDMPKDIDAFRHELARRIDVFVESRRAEAEGADEGAPKEEAT